jgi:hypothetical protein
LSSVFSAASDVKFGSCCRVAKEVVEEQEIKQRS